MNSSVSYPVIEISCSAMRNNLSELRRGKERLLIPVKANAYGLGIEALMPFLMGEDIYALGVANPREGKKLRELGWERMILNLGGFFGEDAGVFPKYKQTPSITDLWQIEALDAVSNEKLEVHINLDTGMGRIGILSDQLDELSQKINSSNHLFVAGIFTHFPLAHKDPLTSKKQVTQLKKWARQLIDKCPNKISDNFYLHAANSAGIINVPESRLDMIRPGLAFYGYFENKEQKELWSSKVNLKPAVCLKVGVISCRSLPKGFGISYDSTFYTPKENFEVSILPLGYADGICRTISKKIKIEGHKILGKVTMDQIIIEGKVEKKTICVLGGKSDSPEEWASYLGTATYEILTNLGNRLSRLLVD